MKNKLLILATVAATFFMQQVANNQIRWTKIHHPATPIRCLSPPNAGSGFVTPGLSNRFVVPGNGFVTPTNRFVVPTNTFVESTNVLVSPSSGNPPQWRAKIIGLMISYGHQTD